MCTPNWLTIVLIFELSLLVGKCAYGLAVYCVFCKCCYIPGIILYVRGKIEKSVQIQIFRFPEHKGQI